MHTLAKRTHIHMYAHETRSAYNYSYVSPSASCRPQPTTVTVNEGQTVQLRVMCDKNVANPVTVRVFCFGSASEFTHCACTLASMCTCMSHPPSQPCTHPHTCAHINTHTRALKHTHTHKKILPEWNTK